MFHVPGWRSAMCVSFAIYRSPGVAARQARRFVTLVRNFPWLSAELDWSAIPVLSEALPLAQSGVFPGGARNNLKAYLERTGRDPALADWQSLLLADPQTSGGLLIAFPLERLDAALADFAHAGIPASVIGRMREPSGRDVLVRA